MNAYFYNVARHNGGYGFYVDLAINDLFAGNECAGNLLGGSNQTGVW